MAEKKDLHKGHRQRMRERVAAEGFDSFNPHQVLEVLLFYAIPRVDVSDTAHALINRFGTVYDTLTAPQEELVKVDGVGKRVAEWLNEVGRLVNSYSALESGDRVKIVNYESVVKLCSKRRKKVKTPSTYHLCIAPSGIVKAFSKLCDSQEWGDARVLRYSMEEVLSSNARHVIIVEFTQDPSPKPTDYEKKYADAYAYTLRMMGAELLDVVMVGSEDCISLNREGIYDCSLYGGAETVLSERYLREDADELAYEDELPVTDSGL